MNLGDLVSFFLRFSGASLNQLPRVWVETLISELSASHLSTENAVSITRRSAGLPPYVQVCTLLYIKYDIGIRSVIYVVLSVICSVV